MSDEDDFTRRRNSEDTAPPDGVDADRPADDQMAPPREPCECWCLHCRRTFMSSEMWFQRVIGDPQGFKGFWMCPTANCGGAGFTFDIFPTDPDHPANAGWVHDEGEDDEEFFDEMDEDGADDEELAALGMAEEGDDDTAAAWDPDETKWKELDEALGDDPDDDDIEGEEWKHGLQPGERPPETDWMEQARREQEAREREYDEPDRRPREIDWSERPDRRRDDHSRPGGSGSGGGDWGGDDDIPF